MFVIIQLGAQAEKSHSLISAGVCAPGGGGSFPKGRAANRNKNVENSRSCRNMVTGFAGTVIRGMKQIFR